jgi:hypothetical protein
MAILLPQTRDFPDGASHRNGLNVCDVTNNLKVHGYALYQLLCQIPSQHLTLPVSGGPQVQSQGQTPSLRCGPSAPLGG